MCDWMTNSAVLLGRETQSDLTWPSALLLMVLLVAPQLGTSQAVAASNIVFIMADDLGWSDTSNRLTNMGHPSDFFETPSLEWLASEGMSFTNAYTNGSNCAPTRAALLTGQYAPRKTNNVYHVNSLNRGGKKTLLVGPPQGTLNGDDAIPLEAYTFAEHLRDHAGYATAHFGKFHVTDPGESGAAQIKKSHGFDFNYGGSTSGHPGNYHVGKAGIFGKAIGPELDAYAAPYTQDYVDKYVRPFSHATDEEAMDALVGTPKHVSDAMTDAAIDFMEKHKHGPFLVQFHPFAVHTPIGPQQARKDLLAKYEGKPPGKEDRHASFAALIEGLDQNIARLLHYLRTTPDPNHPGTMLDSNTVLFFFSDNGGKLDQSNNGPLKGQKGEFTEGGIRVPLIAWSGNHRLVDQGTVNHTPVIGIDFYKTFSSLSEAGDPPGVTLDGEDLTPILADSTAALRRQAIYWHFPGYLDDDPKRNDDRGRNQRPQSIIRSGQWKLIYNYEDQAYELYDLEEDIAETRNVVEEHKQLAASLSDQLMAWLVEVQAPLAKVRRGEVTISVSGKMYANQQITSHAGPLVIRAGDELPMVGL